MYTFYNDAVKINQVPEEQSSKCVAGACLGALDEVQDVAGQHQEETRQKVHDLRDGGRGLNVVVPCC